MRTPRRRISPQRHREHKVEGKWKSGADQARHRILGSNGKVVLDVKGEDEDTEEGNFHHRGSEDTEIKITLY